MTGWKELLIDILKLTDDVTSYQCFRYISVLP